MNFKETFKKVLTLVLAMMVAVSSSLTLVASDNDDSWNELVDEVLKFTNNISKELIAETLNDVKNNKSVTDNIYNVVKEENESLIDEFEYKFPLGYEETREIIRKFLSNKRDVTPEDINDDKIKNTLNNNKNSIIEKLNGDISGAKNQIAKANKYREYLKEGNFYFLEDNSTFKVANTNKLNDIVITFNEESKLEAKLTSSNVKNILSKLNEILDETTRSKLLDEAKMYNLVVKEGAPGGSNTGGGGSTGGGGGGGSSPSVEDKIVSKLEDLKDSSLTQIEKEISKIIETLEGQTVIKASTHIIDFMTDLIKDSTDESVNDIQNATVRIVENLVSKVTDNKVNTKDGVVTVPVSTIKTQIKNAEAIIDILDSNVQEKGIEITKEIEIQIQLLVDKNLDDIKVFVPEGLWESINKKVAIAVSTKNVTIILEDNTFKEDTYSVNILSTDQGTKITTDGTIAKPLTAIFNVNNNTNNYPSVYQLIDGETKLVGGIYNQTTDTVKAYLNSSGMYAVAESQPKPFVDIANLTWEKIAVNELSARGYLEGMTENTFEPYANTTRAQFATMLTRIIPVAEIEGNISFTDLKKDAWYYKSIETAVNQGWLVGRDESTFDPSAAITRQEIAAVLSRILEQKGYLHTSYPVMGINVSDWAKDSVSLYLREVDIDQLSNLDMGQAATRAELAVMFYELMQK